MSSSPSRTHHLAAVWFADLVGYSTLASQNEPAALRLLDLFQEVAAERVTRYGGRIVKLIGDAALAEFTSTEAAVRSALALQREFASRSADLGLPAQLRVGVHLGDVVSAPDGDLYGDGVNITARLQTEAEPGQVLVSEDVWRQLRQRPAYTFTALGERNLKGIAAPVAVFDVQCEETEESSPSPPPAAEGVAEPHETTATRSKATAEAAPASRPRWSAQRVAAVGGVVLLALAGGAFALFGGSVQRVFAPAAPIDRSIAVLPFANLSANPENEYFSDGITEDILTNLANISDLRVISRTSVLGYKGSGKNARQIAEELGVATILEGTVRRAGDRVRINAQLIDARTDRHLYAEAFDREIHDIFAVQTEIASAIAQALRVRLSAQERERIERIPTADPAAYDSYLRGRAYFFQLTPQDNQTAIALFRQALERDPTFALAYTGLSNAYAWRSIEHGHEWTDSALTAARRALALDSELAEAYTALGYAHSRRGERARALEAYTQAIQRKPNASFAVHGAAVVHLQQGRYDEALRGFRSAVQLEPTSGLYHYQVARTNLLLGRLAEAEEWHARARHLLPEHPTLERARALFHAHRGENAQALEAARAALALRPDDPAMLSGVALYAVTLGDLPAARGYLERAMEAARDRDWQPTLSLGLVYWRLGETERARELFRQTLRRADERRAGGDEGWELPLEMASVHAIQGDSEAAYRYIEEAISRGYRDYQGALLDPHLETLRAEPRFQRLLAQMQAEVERMRARVEREGW